MQMHDGVATQWQRPDRLALDELGAIAPRPTGALCALVVGAFLAIGGAGVELMRVADRELARTAALADATTGEIAQTIARGRAAEERQFGTEIARLEAAAARLSATPSESSANPIRAPQNALAAARSTRVSRPEKALRHY
jgi:hypothetical protein